MFLTYDQWYDRCFKRGTSGEMCFDMLKDWKEERTKLLNIVNDLLESVDIPKCTSIEKCIEEY